MKDIAEAAGVSRTTVSFVLNNSPQAKTIKKETRDKILGIAKSLGYRRNAIARAMITGKTRTIGFISPPPKQYFLANMLSGVLAATDKLDYSIRYMETSSEKPIEAITNKILEERLDGVIIQAYSKVRPLWQFLVEHKIPMAVMGNSYPFERGIRVISDDIMGGEMAVEHFVKKGHTSLGYIYSGSESETGKMRLDGYISGCIKHNLKKSLNATLSVRDISGDGIDVFDLKLTEFMTIHSGISGLFTPNLHLATKIIKSLRRIGYRVPEDISIIAYSVSEINNCFDPPITSIDQNHFNMGYTAGTALIEYMESGTGDIFDNILLKKLPVSLFKGASVAEIHQKV